MNPFMYRLLFSSVLLVTLAACAMGPGRGGPQAKVIGESQYCGTASQDSNVLYFADASAFGDWIDYRGINEFDADMASGNGLVVIEMGQRPTGGYNVQLDKSRTAIENGTLTIGMEWNAPRLDAAVSQALIASCVAVRPPQGDYDTVRVIDQLGKARGETRVSR
ncbi:protease complex subunit PrcB family protein [Salinisphaera dokdonensis]